MQVKARFSPFGHPTQINTSWVMSYVVLLANWKKFRICLLWIGLFGTCVYLWGNLQMCLATQRKSLCKFSLCPPATTCRSIWPGLKGVCPSFLLLLNGILWAVCYTYIHVWLFCRDAVQIIIMWCCSRSAYPDFYFYAVCSITVIVHIWDAFIRWLCHYLFVPAPVWETLPFMLPSG